MVKIGNAKIKYLSVGDAKIKKAYVGEDLIFGETKPSRLPEGYTEVEYIQFDSKTGFNTGLYVTPSSTTIVLDIEVETVYPGSEEQFASMLASKAGQSTSESYMLSFGRVSETRTYCRAGSTSSIKYLDVSVTGERAEVKFDGPNSLFSIAGEGVSISKFNYNLYTKTFYIGAPSNNWKSVPYKLYSAKIYRANSLLRDFVPCINPEKTVGLYDLAYNAFYPNVLSGTVTAGPAA